jgi:hypothetical protein
MMNIILIVTYTILTSIVFKPWWIGFTVGMWIAIFELTLIIFIKYYQMYYKVLIKKT